jgi:hypothetical protein
MSDDKAVNSSDESDTAIEDLKKSEKIKDREISELKKRVEDEKQLSQIHLTMIRELQAQLTSQARLGMILLSLLVVAGIIMFGFG